MVKKKLVNLNPSSNFDIALAKLSVKERGKAMADGQMPDEWDYKNISKELKRYEARHPGLIARMANGVYQEILASDITKHAVLSQDSGLQKAFWLPNDLQIWLEMAYPTFWANKKHIRWFCRKFPVFAYETYTKAIKR